MGFKETGRRRALGDEGVSPVIGTLMILGVTALAIPAVLVFGAPLLRDLRDDAALAKVGGQLEEARHTAHRLNVQSATGRVPFQVPVGNLGIEEGTTFMLAAEMDDDALYRTCDRKLTGWTDGDDRVSVAAAIGTVCRSISTNNNDNTCEEVRIDNVAPIPDVIVPALAVCVDAAVWDGDAWNTIDVATNTVGVLRLDDDLDVRGSYRIRYYYTDADGQRVDTGAAWHVPGHRLTWSSNSVRTLYEHGALLVAQRSPAVLTDTWRVAETAGAQGETFFLRLVTLEGSGAAAGEVGAILQLETRATKVLLTDAEATRIRFDFVGDLAPAWCQAMVARNDAQGLQAPDPIYREDALATCATGSAEGLHSVTYSTLTPSATFPTEISHAHLDASLSIG